MVDLDGQEIRIAGKKALARRRKLREVYRSDIIPEGATTSEHYHLLFTLPKLEVTVPDYGRLYASQRLAFLALKELGEQAEPRVEWFDDGHIRFETRVHGMTGLHWMIGEVALCKRLICSSNNNDFEIVRK
jgi:hypothetical protein